MPCVQESLSNLNKMPSMETPSQYNFRMCQVLHLYQPLCRVGYNLDDYAQYNKKRCITVEKTLRTTVQVK